MSTKVLGVESLDSIRHHKMALTSVAAAWPLSVIKLCAHVQVRAKSLPTPGHASEIMSKRPIRRGHAALGTI